MEQASCETGMALGATEAQFPTPQTLPSDTHPVIKVEICTQTPPPCPLSPYPALLLSLRLYTDILYFTCFQVLVFPPPSTTRKTP